MLTLLYTMAVFGIIDNNDSDLLKVIENAYNSNVAMIDTGKAAFVIVEGTVGSVEQATSGKIDKPVRSQGLYIFSGKNLRYEHIYATKDLIDTMQVLDEKTTGNRFQSCQILTNGKATFENIMYIAPEDKSYNQRGLITEGLKAIDLAYSFPLNVGFTNHRMNNLALDIERARNNPTQLNCVIDDTMLANEHLYIVTLADKNTKRTYWIDVKKSCVPTKVIDYDSKNNIQWITLYESMKQLGNGAWLPYRMIRFNNKSKRVKRMDIESFQQDVQDTSVFRVTFSQPITIIDSIKNIRHEKATTFGFGQIGSREPARPIRVVNAPSPASGPILPGEVESSSRWSLWLLLGAAFLIILGFYYRRRRRIAPGGFK